MGESAEEFQQRARMEAARYGSDPWVFVRELLQNARDAGASEVRFSVDRTGGFDRIVCRDDGEGMTFEHARRFLLTLYSSSKVEDERAAGRFGIGFWSVLRFNPSKLTIRSRPPAGDGWEVAIDGGFRSVRQRTLVMQPGTEIVLERPASDEDLAARVAAVVRSQIRFLMRRDDPQTAVRIMINDEAVVSDREPKPPMLTVEEPGLRLTVALGETPSVEVFAHGIRVRTASFLDELLAEGRFNGPASVEIPNGLLPQVELDSTRLQVLLARGDARQDRVLSGMVHRAERELARLVGEELDLLSARSRVARVWDRIRGSRLGWRWTAALVTAGAVIAVAVGLGRTSLINRIKSSPATTSVGASEDLQPAGDEIATGIGPRPYRDLSAAYLGPRVDALSASPTVDLRYRPEIAEPLFAALRIGGLDEAGGTLAPESGRVMGPYRGMVCADACLEVELAIEGGPGLVRIPVPSGHTIDPESVTLDGRPVRLLELGSGEPAARFDAPAAGLLSYLSGANTSPEPLREPVWPELPADLDEAAVELAGVAPAERVSTATELVASLITYDRSAATARRLERERQTGGGFVRSAVAVGAGDCDVQNAVLATVLGRSGLPSWLVVGYMGAGGRVRPGLHAWVESFDGESWRVADASGGGGPSAANVTAAQDPPESTDSAAMPTARETGRPPTALVSWLIGVGLCLLALAGAVMLSRRRASVRTVTSDGTADLGRLLRSVLLRPAAFRGVGGLFDRPLVPALGGGRMSLRSAIRASRAGTLFRGSRDSEVARRASSRGDAVIDVTLSEGAAVADLLGARDLDGWDGLLDRASINAAIELAETALRRLGGAWLIRAAERPPQRLSTIEGALVGFGRRLRVAVVDTSSGLWRTVESAVPDRPAWAAFVLAEGIADRLDMDPSIRQRWLAELAREAVTEGGGKTP